MTSSGAPPRLSSCRQAFPVFVNRKFRAQKMRSNGFRVLENLLRSRLDLSEVIVLKMKHTCKPTIVAPCPKCGARRTWRGFLPHEDDACIRIDFYRCVSCDQKTEEMNPAE